MPIAGTFHELTKYSRNDFYTPADILTILQDVGFSEIHFVRESISTDFTSLLASLKGIKAIGANYLFTKPTLRLPREVLLDSAGKYTLTYNIGYFITKKA